MTRQKKTPKASWSMSTAEYRAALVKLGLSPATHQTSEAFGLSIRQLIAINHGQAKVKGPLARLILMYLRWGLL